MHTGPLNYPDWKFPSKYAEEYSVLAGWMIFGWHPGPEIDTSQVGWAEKCDVVDIVEMTPATNDVFTRVPKAKAEKIVELRNRFVADVMAILAEEPK